MSNAQDNRFYRENTRHVVTDGQMDALAAAIHEQGAERAALIAALADMLAGWRYIRQSHGDLYGVGWDRAQEKAEKALGLEPGGSPTQAMFDAARGIVSPAGIETEGLNAEGARARSEGRALTTTPHDPGEGSKP